MDEQIFTQTYQQNRILPVKNTVRGKNCPNGTWQIEGPDLEDPNRKPVCSDIDLKLCTNINPDATVAWNSIIDIENKDGTISTVSTDGKIDCMWDRTTLDSGGMERYQNSINKQNIPFDAFSCDASLRSTSARCFKATSTDTLGKGCPVDTHITGKTMPRCSNWIAINNGHIPSNKNLETRCKICVGEHIIDDLILDSDIADWCTTGSEKSLGQKLDCACFDPVGSIKHPRDPVLGAKVANDPNKTVYQLMDEKYPELVSERGLWYSPCGSKEYLTPSTQTKAALGISKQNRVCKLLNNFLIINEGGLSNTQIEELKSRSECYNSSGELKGPAVQVRSRSEGIIWFIIAGVIFFVILFMIVIAGTTGEGKY